MFSLVIIYYLSIIVFLASGCVPAFASDMVPVAYTANTPANTVSVIDMRDNTVFATIYDVNSPTSVAITPDGGWLYVTNGETNNVTYVNMSSFRITGTIPVGNAPYGIAITPDGGTAYVTNYMLNTVSIINITNNKVNGTINVGKGPYGIRINPVNGEAYVINSDEGTISVIRDKSVVATIPAGNHTIRGLAVTPDGNHLLVANKNNNTISAVNTTTYMVINTVDTGISPTDIAISPNGWYAFIACPGSRNIEDMQISDYTTRVNFSMDNTSRIGFRPDGTLVYVITTPDGNIKAMDSASGEVKATIGVHATDMEIAAVRSSLLADTIPPVTTLNLYGEKDASGAYIGEVKCNITAMDYPSGSELKDSWYSFDGLNWVSYAGNFTLTTPVNVTVYYFSVDKAGNREWSRSTLVRIVSKATTPSASLGPTPTIMQANASIWTGPSLPPQGTSPPTGGTPKPSSGFESVLAAIGMLGVGYLIRKK